jgi:hypothetical protein
MLSVQNIEPKDRDRWMHSGPLLVFVVMYVGTLVALSTVASFDRINDRLLSPVLVPVTALLLASVSYMVQRLASHFAWISPRMTSFFLMAVITVGLLHPAQVTASLVADYFAQAGWGYGAKSWRENKTIQYLRQHQTFELGCTIYSNAPDALYLLANLAPRSIPDRLGYTWPKNSSQAVGTAQCNDAVIAVPADANRISCLVGVWPEEDKACIAWLDRIDRSYLLGLGELSTVANLQETVRFDDGVIFSVTRK